MGGTEAIGGSGSLSHITVCEGAAFPLLAGRLSASLARSRAPSRSQLVFPIEREDAVGRLLLHTIAWLVWCTVLLSLLPVTSVEEDRAVSQGVKYMVPRQVSAAIGCENCGTAGDPVELVRAPWTANDEAGRYSDMT